MKYLWILVIFLFMSFAKAKATGLEHFGVAYAGSTFGYGLTEKMFKTDNQLFNIIFTDIVITSFLVFAETDKPCFNKATFGAGLAGMLMSNFTVKVFSW